MSGEGAIRVLVAEDSATTAALLVHALQRDPGLAIAGMASDGAEAVALTAKLRPDVIVMDIRMPAMDGFEATRRIMAETPTPIVIVTASLDPNAVSVSLHALSAGALTVIPKPPGPAAGEFEEAGARFAATVRAMAEVKVVRRWPGRTPGGAEARSRVAASRAADGRKVVAIAVSTGGPAALQQILAGLTPEFPAPVLVVQHMAAGFVGGLAGWLNANSPLPVKVAEDGEPLRPGAVYLAPDGAHLGATGHGRIRLSDAPPVGGFRPSGSILFESVAAGFGPGTVAVVLTGMGEDGVAGLKSVRAAGGTVLVQDEATSVVFGMPGRAVALGLADEVEPLSAIAGRLAALTAGAEAGKPA